MIIYTDFIYNVLEPDEAKKLDDYRELHFVDDKLKIRKLFTYQELTDIEHFLSESDQEASILEGYSEEYPTACITFITRSEKGAFVTELHSAYLKTELAYRSQFLFMLNKEYYSGRSKYICSQSIDLMTGLADLGSTSKQYFFPEKEEEGHVPYFEAEYDDDGEVDMFTYFEVPDPYGDDSEERNGCYQYPSEEASTFGDSLPGFPGYFLDATLDPFEVKARSNS
ncbi:MAG: hypothetical protein AAFQ98_15480 [Bacteroidota bacterium]